MVAQAGIDWCKYCDVIPRHPCQSNQEAAACPNATPMTRELCRSRLPGYSQSEADELAEYRRRYGRLR
jgi:hypothetical protein